MSTSETRMRNGIKNEALLSIGIGYIEICASEGGSNLYIDSAKVYSTIEEITRRASVERITIAEVRWSEYRSILNPECILEVSKPKTEPSIGTLAWAYEMLKDGKKIRLKVWDRDVCLYSYGNEVWIRYDSVTSDNTRPFYWGVACVTFDNFVAVVSEYSDTEWELYTENNVDTTSQETYKVGSNEWALEQLKDGKSIALEGWGKDIWVYKGSTLIAENNIYLSNGNAWTWNIDFITLDNFVEKLASNTLPWKLYDDTTTSTPIIVIILHKTNGTTQDFYINTDKGLYEGIDERSMRDIIKYKLNPTCSSSYAKDVFVELFDELINTSLISHITFETQHPT
jgi:hypothetical protein